VPKRITIRPEYPARNARYTILLDTVVNTDRIGRQQL